jgi:predicted nucleic acid-binding protein
LETIGVATSVAEFARPHAVRAAQLAAELKSSQIGFADFQIAATALVDGAELLTFNREHFGRVAGLTLAAV